MFGLPSGYKNSQKAIPHKTHTCEVFIKHGNTKGKDSKLIFTKCTVLVSE
jgi:hypothetical protein